MRKRGHRRCERGNPEPTSTCGMGRESPSGCGRGAGGRGDLWGALMGGPCGALLVVGVAAGHDGSSGTATQRPGGVYVYQGKHDEEEDTRYAVVYIHCTYTVCIHWIHATLACVDTDTLHHKTHMCTPYTPPTLTHNIPPPVYRWLCCSQQL